jgi:hypothetical protein
MQKYTLFYFFYFAHFDYFILLYNIINTINTIMSLNTIFDWDYEFQFYTNDITDITKFDAIYNQCTIEDPSGNRRALIYDKCLQILQILSMISGIHIFASFVSYNNKQYKITIHNMSWSGDIPP